jgi:hypothetical protein
MGGARTICENFPLGTRALIMDCKVGHFDAGKAVFGVVSADAYVQN